MPFLKSKPLNFVICCQATLYSSVNVEVRVHVQSPPPSPTIKQILRIRTPRICTPITIKKLFPNYLNASDIYKRVIVIPLVLQFFGNIIEHVLIG